MSFSMFPQVEESPECLAWEDMEQFFREQDRVMKAFYYGVEQLAEYSKNAPLSCFHSVVDEAYAAVMTDSSQFAMKELFSGYGITSARELAIFVRGFAFNK